MRQGRLFRPCWSTGYWTGCMVKLRGSVSPHVIPGIPVVDTIKVMDEEKKVVATPDRKHLMAVQTPQGFSLAFLRAAHQRAEQEGWVVTDDASLLELCGHAVHVAEGEAGNKKITTPEDLEMLRMTGERIPCVGYGYDVHSMLMA